jgi:hypothetical protein
MSAVIDPQGAANTKLPLWDTIGRSYSTYVNNLGDVLRICWLWLVVGAVLGGIASWVQWSWLIGTLAELKRGISPQMQPFRVSMPIGMFVLLYGTSLLWILAGVSIAVAWHRRIILGERPRFSGSNVATASVWRYLGMGLAICLIAALPAVLLFLLGLLLTGGVATLPTFKTVGFIALFVIVYVAAIAVMLRLTALLPARAVGDLGLTFGETWRRTRGNTWRLFWGLLICILPPLLVMQIATLVLLGFPSPAEAFAGGTLPVRFAIIHAMSLDWYLLVTPIGIGFLSLSYLHFFERARINVRDD